VSVAVEELGERDLSERGEAYGCQFRSVKGALGEVPGELTGEACCSGAHVEEMSN